MVAVSGCGGARRARRGALPRQSEREKARASEWSERRVHDAYVPTLARPVGPMLVYGRHTTVMAYGQSATGVRVNTAVRADYDN